MIEWNTRNYQNDIERKEKKKKKKKTASEN